jgi:hypothetical protein
MCTCNGDTCAFTCASPPCDADCINVATCTAECGAATCNCQGASDCDFTCVQANCAVACQSGSQCSLDCDTLTPESAQCDITVCQGGAVTLCPDNRTLVCNKPCPT